MCFISVIGIVSSPPGQIRNTSNRIFFVNFEGFLLFFLNNFLVTHLFKGYEK